MHAPIVKTARPRAALFGLLLATALLATLAGCAEGQREIDPPSDEAARDALLQVIGRAAPEEVPPETLAALDEGEEGVSYVPPSDEHMRLLRLPAPIEDLRIEEKRVQYYPAWRIAYRPIIDGQEGPLLVSELVRLEGNWRVVLRWRPAREDEEGRLQPDFRPGVAGPEAGLEGRPVVAVVAQPPWTDLRLGLQ